MVALSLFAWQSRNQRRAKEVLAENQKLSTAEVAKKADVSESTVKNAKRAMKEGATIAPSPAEDEAADQPQKQLNDAEQAIKKAERLQAEVHKKFTAWTDRYVNDIGIETMSGIFKAEVGAWLDKYATPLGCS